MWHANPNIATNNKNISTKAIDHLSDVNLTDMFREIHNDSKEYSFIKQTKEGLIDYKSRIDLCLATNTIKHAFTNVEYLDMVDFAPDHCPILCSILVKNNTPIKKDKTQYKPLETTIEKPDIYNINSDTNNIFNSRINKYLIDINTDNKNIPLDEFIDKIMKDAKITYGIKNISLNKAKYLNNDKIDTLSLQSTRLFQALRGRINAKNPSLKCQHLLNNGLSFQPEYIKNKTEIKFNNQEDIITFKHQIRIILKEINEKIKSKKNEKTQEKIKRCIDELNKTEFMTPRDFFRKVNHDKATAIKCNT